MNGFQTPLSVLLCHDMSDTAEGEEVFGLG